MEQKNTAELQAELATLGLLVLVFGLFVLSGNILEPLALMLAGIILLGSGIYQAQRGWPVSWTTWVLGVLLVLGGLGIRLFLVAVLNINWLAIGILLVGGIAVYQALFRKR